MDDLLDERFDGSHGLEGDHRAEAGLHGQLDVAGPDLVRFDVDGANFELVEEPERVLQVHPGDVGRVVVFLGGGVPAGNGLKGLRIDAKHISGVFFNRSTEPFYCILSVFECFFLHAYSKLLKSKTRKFGF